MPGPPCYVGHLCSYNAGMGKGDYSVYLGPEP